MHELVPLVALFLALFIIHPDPSGGVAPPEARRWQQGPWPATCRQPLALAAVGPHPAKPSGLANGAPSGEDGGRGLLARHEWVAVHNPAPVAVQLDGWTLRSRRGRRGPLPRLLLEPGATQLLPLSTGSALKLANGGGTLSVVDPCGHVRDTFTWGEAAEGTAFVRDAWRGALSGGPEISAVPLAAISPRSLLAIDPRLKRPRPSW